MSDQQKPQEQKPNIRLREKQEPVTLGSLGYRGITLPDSKEKQAAGWYEPLAQAVVSLYGSHYELLNQG